MLAGSPPDVASPSEDDPPRPMALQWFGQPSCPSAEVFVAGMNALMGHRLVIREDADVTLTVSIQRAGRVFTMQLDWTHPSGSGSRRLDAPECRTLVNAGSLLAATQLSEVWSEIQAPPRASDIPEPPPPPPPLPLPPPAEGASQPAPPFDPELRRSVAIDPPPPHQAPPRTEGPASRLRARPKLAVSLFGGALMGAGPPVAGGLRGQLEVRWPRLWLGAWGQHVFAARPPAILPDLPIEVSTTQGGLLLCGAWRVTERAAFTVPACVGADLGSVAARRLDGVAGRRRHVRLGMPVEVGCVWSVLRWFQLRVAAGANFAVLRPGFHVQTTGDPQVIFRSPALMGYVLLGVSGQWP